MTLAPDALQHCLIEWYRREGRTLPWRETEDPYAILVSEVMLQQTQVARVLPRYSAWLERWPDVHALAAAAVSDVIAAWSGLGYNNRAVRLQRAAVVIGEDGWPSDVAGLQRLPGVGPYTAAAIACQAFGADVVPVDVNVTRILERVDGATAIEPHPGTANELTQALFDLGATICLARVPRCGACPLADGCRSAGMRFEPARRQGRFEGSRRQARGRLLREAQAGPVAVNEENVEIAAALEKDGLVVVRDGVVRLPG